ncbi:TraI domain-containing protein [Pseudoalteromonas sp. T1lg23B]|uniref:TraI domain-containing protein n=1 Tax=Pseudoalteromonas sp. T1lg23B TaxID=2077097 RepID=UPI000CF5F79F|nr:TraI domain-containing protein [Pseudoalteromonas sp. T1lg23B]
MAAFNQLPMFFQWCKTQLGERREPSLASLLLHYPPVSYGTPISSRAAIVKHFDRQFNVLLPAAGLRMHAKQGVPSFTALYQETLLNFTSYAHLLPSHRFALNDVGDLLMHSLTTSHSCLELARAQEENIPRSRQEMNIDIQKKLKPRWIYGTWIAALLHDLATTLSRVSVNSKTQNCPAWDPLHENLFSWAKRYQVKHYQVHWQNNVRDGSEKLAHMLYTNIVSDAGKQYLADAGDTLKVQLERFLNGHQDHSFMDRIILDTSNVLARSYKGASLKSIDSISNTLTPDPEQINNPHVQTRTTRKRQRGRSKLRSPIVAILTDAIAEQFDLLFAHQEILLLDSQILLDIESISRLTKQDTLSVIDACKKQALTSEPVIKQIIFNEKNKHYLVLSDTLSDIIFQSYPKAHCDNVIVRHLNETSHCESQHTLSIIRFNGALYAEQGVDLQAHEITNNRAQPPVVYIEGTAHHRLAFDTKETSHG